MDLDLAILMLARHAATGDFDTDGLTQELAGSDTGAQFERVLAEGLATDELSMERYVAASGGAFSGDFDAALGRLWSAMVERGIFSDVVGSPQHLTASIVRRWAYNEEWWLSSDDEDLFLMRDDCMPWLLEVAADGDCPKRDYMLDIVAHWARDSAHAAAGTERFAAVLQRCSDWAPMARGVGAEAVAVYLERLASYGAPRAVDRTLAAQLASDLARCAAPDPESIDVREDDEYWTVTLAASVPRRITISRDDGAIEFVARVLPDW